MNRIHFTSLLCALTAAIALAGCGKTGDATTTGTTTAPMAPASAASR